MWFGNNDTRLEKKLIDTYTRLKIPLMPEGEAKQLAKSILAMAKKRAEIKRGSL
jgi:hypothetical protein